MIVRVLHIQKIEVEETHRWELQVWPSSRLCGNHGIEHQAELCQE